MFKNKLVSLMSLWHSWKWKPREKLCFSDNNSIHLLRKLLFSLIFNNKKLTRGQSIKVYCFNVQVRDSLIFWGTLLHFLYLEFVILHCKSIKWAVNPIETYTQLSKVRLDAWETWWDNMIEVVTIMRLTLYQDIYVGHWYNLVIGWEPFKLQDIGNWNFIICIDNALFSCFWGERLWRSFP